MNSSPATSSHHHLHDRYNVRSLVNNLVQRRISKRKPTTSLPGNPLTDNFSTAELQNAAKAITLLSEAPISIPTPIITTSTSLSSSVLPNHHNQKNNNNENKNTTLHHSNKAAENSSSQRVMEAAEKLLDMKNLKTGERNQNTDPHHHHFQSHHNDMAVQMPQASNQKRNLKRTFTDLSGGVEEGDKPHEEIRREVKVIDEKHKKNMYRAIKLAYPSKTSNIEFIPSKFGLLFGQTQHSQSLNPLISILFETNRE